MIEFNKLTISKCTPFKNINGKYCFINYDGGKLIVKLPVLSTVLFDINLNYPKPNLFINLTNPQLIGFNELLKNALITHVFEHKIYGHTPMEILDGYYVNPHKMIQSKKKIADTLKLKLGKSMSLSRGDQINGSIHISGMWFNENSFGPYFNIDTVEVVDGPVKSLFVETTNKPLFVEEN